MTSAAARGRVPDRRLRDTAGRPLPMHGRAGEPLGQAQATTDEVSVPPVRTLPMRWPVLGFGRSVSANTSGPAARGSPIGNAGSRPGPGRPLSPDRPQGHRPRERRLCSFARARRSSPRSSPWCRHRTSGRSGIASMSRREGRWCRALAGRQGNPGLLGPWRVGDRPSRVQRRVEERVRSKATVDRLVVLTGHPRDEAVAEIQLRDV